MRRWFKLWMRKKTRPMAIGYAKLMKQKLSALYCFLAFNAAGLMLIYKARTSYPRTEKEKRNSALYYSRLWQAGDVTVLNMRGFKCVDTFEIKGIPALTPDVSEFVPEPTTSDNETLEQLD